MKNRGFSSIGLYNPKFDCNIGGVLRVVGCFNSSLLLIEGARYKKSAPDTTKQHRHTPVLEVGSLIDTIPIGATPVAVEIVEGARKLNEYTHPSSAHYLFGPEDGSLSDEILDSCTHKIYIPAEFCLNLAAAVNVVLYDRLSKQSNIGG